MTNKMRETIEGKPVIVHYSKNATRSSTDPQIKDYVNFGYCITYEGKTGYTLTLEQPYNL